MARTKYKNVREFISLFIFLYTVPPERLLYIYIYIYVGLVATYEVKNTGVVFRYMPVKS
jgi:hypothetical protein